MNNSYQRARKPTALTFNQALAAMTANAIGIDPNLAAEAGEEVRPLLADLRRILRQQKGSGRDLELDKLLGDLQSKQSQIPSYMYAAIGKRIRDAQAGAPAAAVAFTGGGTTGDDAMSDFIENSEDNQPRKPEDSPDCPEEGRRLVGEIRFNKDQLMSVEAALNALAKLKQDRDYATPDLQNQINSAFSEMSTIKATLEYAIEGKEEEVRENYPRCLSFVSA